MFSKIHFFLVAVFLLIVSCKKDDSVPKDTLQEPTLLQWYVDGDADGFGNPDTSLGKMAVPKPSGFVADNTDCDDGDALINPNVDEDDEYDGVDSNCDGIAENMITTYSKTIGEGDYYEDSQFLFAVEDGNFISGGWRRPETPANTEFNFDFWVIKVDADGNTLWEKSYGGSKRELLRNMVKTTDGGFIMTGSTTSDDGDVGVNYGKSDWWILKISSEGQILWTKVLGGNDDDAAYNIIEAKDGGYVVVGKSESFDGELPAVTNQDAYAVKLDVSGNILWKYRYSKEELEETYLESISAILELSDGSLIASGGSFESGSNSKIRLYKLNENGTVLWTQRIESYFVQRITNIIEFGESSILLGGTSKLDFDEPADVLLLNINTAGEINWSKLVGNENDDEEVYTIIKTFDDGIMLAGQKVVPNPIVYDPNAWVAKLDGTGNIEWQNTFGGRFRDNAYGIVDLQEEGYIISGSSTSTDGDLPGNGTGKLLSDMWLFKLKPNGKF